MFNGNIRKEQSESFQLLCIEMSLCNMYMKPVESQGDLLFLWCKTHVKVYMTQ